MNAHWAYNWVQIMAHNKKLLSIVWVALSLFTSLGLFELDAGLLSGHSGLFGVGRADWILLFASLVLMSLTLGFLMDSFRAGLVQLLLSGYILLMLFGVLGWMNSEFTHESLLAIVVVVTLLTSNLVHILSTLLREMARGAFQYDAVSEALKLNATPIFLSNLTTALGFIFAAWFDASLVNLAVIVTLGVVISYLSAMTWLPMFLLSYLLEFRVGNSQDRHGFSVFAKWLVEHSRIRQILLWFSALFTLGLVGLHWFVLPQLQGVFWLAGSFLLLFLLFWRSLKLALINVVINLVALLLTVTLLMAFIELDNINLLLLMVPLGLIVDDGIHFFSRYVRAQQSVFTDAESAVRYSMASVGRTIWVTSWVLLVGLSVLLFSQSDLVALASLVTLLALVIATLLVLVVVPALLIAFGDKKTGGI